MTPNPQHIPAAIAFSLILFSVTGASAQTLSAADIAAQIDKKVEAGNEYQQLLNDPDPARSMAAMEIMLGSGDEKLARMALDYGLYSPNPVVRRTALEGFFSGGPVLNMLFDPGDAKVGSSFTSAIGSWNGTIGSDGSGFLSIKVGDYDPDRSCYVYATSPRKCFVRLSDTGVSFKLWRDGWWATKLNDEGKLVGSGSMYAVATPVSLTVPVTP